MRQFQEDVTAHLTYFKIKRSATSPLTSGYHLLLHFHMFVFYVTFYSLCLGRTRKYNDTGDDILAPAPQEPPLVIGEMISHSSL